jgi:hypothetical protein
VQEGDAFSEAELRLAEVAEAERREGLDPHTGPEAAKTEQVKDAG